jgi:delta-1-pyrroline-5-carboxylate synthetase
MSLSVQICQSLKQKGVAIYSGPRLSAALTFGPPAAEKLSLEYGDLACTVELVAGLEEAVEHIHKYGSSHTEVIVTEDAAAADRFLAAVDSACVFHNVSSRWGENFPV